MAAGDAQRLLGDETLNEAFDFVRQSAFEAAMRCHPTDDIGRHRYLLAAQVVEQTKSYLAAVISADEVERTRLKEREIANFYEIKARSRFRDSGNRNTEAHLTRVIDGVA